MRTAYKTRFVLAAATCLLAVAGCDRDEPGERALARGDKARAGNAGTASEPAPASKRRSVAREAGEAAAKKRELARNDAAEKARRSARRRPQTRGSKQPRLQARQAAQQVCGAARNARRAGTRPGAGLDRACARLRMAAGSRDAREAQALLDEVTRELVGRR